MKIGNSKAFNALGLILLTFQILVFLFKYIVDIADIMEFFMANLLGMLGYVLLLTLFIKKIINEDIILTVIGCLLWVAQFVNVFKEFQGEPLTAFLYCSAGILGVILIALGLVLFSAKDKKNKK